MRHQIAWAQTAAGSDGEPAYIAAVQDGVIYSEGDDIRVPGDLAMIAGYAVINNNSQSGLSLFTSPRMRRESNLYVPQVTDDGTIGDQYPYLQLIRGPKPLTPQESLRFQRTVSTVAGTTTIAIIELIDGAMNPVRGDIISVNVFATNTGPGLVWNNSPITFREILPTGEYDVVGMTWTGGNLVAARMQFPGLPYRPGCLARSNVSISPYWETMAGNSGTWGRFHTNQQPSMDFLGLDTLTSQIGYLDLIAV